MYKDSLISLKKTIKRLLAIFCLFSHILFTYVFIYFWHHHAVCGILAPRPGTELTPLAMKAQSPNHWTARELLSFSHYICFYPNIPFRKSLHCCSLILTPFSRGSSQPRDWTQVSHIAGGFLTSWATREALQAMELSRPEYWSGEPFPSPGDLPNTRIKPRSPALQVDS